MIYDTDYHPFAVEAMASVSAPLNVSVIQKSDHRRSLVDALALTPGVVRTCGRIRVGWPVGDQLTFEKLASSLEDY